MEHPGKVLLLVMGLVGCGAGLGPAGGPAPAAASSAEKVGELMREGQLAEAVTEARRSADAARAHPNDRPTLALSLQMLGLALARADLTDEALRVADELRGIPGAVSYLGVQADVALRRCRFDDASAAFLTLREQTPGGRNDVPTEGGLAAVDLSEGRTERAIERLEHALSRPRPEGFNDKLWTAVQGELRVWLASAYARTGRTREVASKLTPEDTARLRRSALATADYALAQQRALYLAEQSLASAILAEEATGVPREQTSELRERHRRVLEAYRATPGSCRDVVPDPLALEDPGARLRLAPTAPTGAEAATATTPPSAGPLDADQDGILDSADRCPGQREVYNGRDDTDGCPDEAPGFLAGREIRLKEQLQFAHDSADLDPQGKPILDWLASFLKARPDIVRASIEGHTDDVGETGYNLELSRRRAQAVLDALAQRGVGGNRLRSEGYGESRPKVLGTDAATRALNRRVEIIVDLVVPAAASEQGATLRTPATAAGASTGAPGASAPSGTIVVRATALESEVRLALSRDGAAVGGPFVVSPHDGASFSVPAGRLRWTHQDSNCEDSGEVEVTAGATATLECWTSAKMGDCCKTGTLAGD